MKEKDRVISNEFFRGKYILGWQIYICNLYVVDFHFISTNKQFITKIFFSKFYLKIW